MPEFYEVYTNRMREKYGDPFQLELGPGKHDVPDRAKIGLNEKSDPGSDIYWNLNFGIPLCSMCVSHIHSNQVLEHIDEIIPLFNAMWRVLIPGGTMQHVVPHFLSPHAWGDPTHVRAFSEESFKYFCKGDDGKPFSIAFSDYGIIANFTLVYQVVSGDLIIVEMRKDE